MGPRAQGFLTPAGLCSGPELSCLPRCLLWPPNLPARALIPDTVWRPVTHVARGSCTQYCGCEVSVWVTTGDSLTGESLGGGPWLGSDPVCLPLQMEVQAPPGTTIGHVLQTWHPFLPKFSIQDADRRTVLRVVGPCWTCGCGTDTNFEVKTPDESRSVGRISKQWGGLLREALTDADDFGLQFPLDLDVRVKAVLLGATFLIDYIFFEKRGGAGPSAITS
uniref:Phospholipid scramblase n=1 Tax=Ursus maritimus TaxID=29073 RepID=A0A452UK52_URSMA